jgi:hypothetical protein
MALEYFKEEVMSGMALSHTLRKEKEIEDILVLGGGIVPDVGRYQPPEGINCSPGELGDAVPQRRWRSGMRSLQCPCQSSSNVDPDEWAEHMAERPYSNGIGLEIQCREDWDTLLEMEHMGGKIRDTENQYIGAQGRDDKSMLMLSPRYTRYHSYLPPSLFPKLNLKSNPDYKLTNVVIRVWVSTFKPFFKK